MEVRSLGLMRYRDALAVMEACHAEVSSQANHPGCILVVEHPPVVTMGNRFLPEDMHVSPEAFQNLQIDFEKIDRGGSATVHEPGQVVVYPIVKLDPTVLTVKNFVWTLEEAMIRLCASFGVSAARDSINAGVWVGMNKIGALGIRVQNRVTKHGLAFNVTNSLATFQWIIPCGLRQRGVTTLSQECSKLNEPMRPLSDVSVERISEELPKLIIEILAGFRHPSS